jgi:hypothetical protein
MKPSRCVWCNGPVPRSRTVAALGADGLRRIHDIYYRGVPWAAPDLRGAGREIVDVWSRMLFELAVANPETYLEQVAARRLKLTTLEVVILGAIDDPSATALLVRCCRERDWLIRFARGGRARAQGRSRGGRGRGGRREDRLLSCGAGGRGQRRGTARSAPRPRALPSTSGPPAPNPLLKQEIEHELEQPR